ncbi:MAG TPA: radical SAM protein [Nanoarchaeota archaeon]|nr:radical SAM protein [Nanoarchaeota archaeon]
MGIIDYLYYVRRAIFRRGMPLHLTLFVTKKCNCRCRHCFFWKEINKDEKEFSLADIRNLSKSMGRLLLLNISGGEPFLRKDLPEILHEFYKNNKTRHFAIPTNGLLSQQTVDSTKHILRLCPDAAIVVYVSLDGLQRVHDNIRGVKGTFKKAVSTFYALKELKKEFKNLDVGTLTTLTGYNQKEFPKLYDYITRKMKPDMAYLNIVRGSPKNEGAKAVSIKSYRKACEIIEKDIRKGDIANKGFFLSPFANAVNILAHKLNLETFGKKKCLIRCLAGNLSGVVYSNGMVYPCELLNMPIGNLNQTGYDLRKLWLSKKAEEIQKQITDKKCFCTHECVMNINLIFNLRFWPKIIYEGVRLF